MAITINRFQSGLDRVPSFESSADSVCESLPDVPDSPPNRAGILEIDRLLAIGYRGLRFPASLERRYQTDRDPERRRYDLYSHAAGLLCYLSFLISDRLMIPDIFNQAVRLRLFCCVGMLAIFLALRVFGTRRPILRELFIVVVSVTCAYTLVYLARQTHAMWGNFYIAGLVPVVLFINTVTRARFWFAVASSVLILIGAIVALGAQNPIPTTIQYAFLLLLGFSVAFTLYSNYQLEHDDRTAYLLRLRDRLQRARELRLLNRLGDLSRRYQALSLADALTGTSNRRHLNEYLQALWPRMARDNGELSMLLLDVDHFKAFNDTYGHPAGDDCLRKVAGAIRSGLRSPDDFIARFGGEEFVVVLPGYSEQRSAEIGQRIRNAVQALAVPNRGSSAAEVVTISVGVASLRPSTPGSTQEQLIAAADAALYCAKSAGRNQVWCASDICNDAPAPVRRAVA